MQDVFLQVIFEYLECILEVRLAFRHTGGCVRERHAPL